MRPLSDEQLERYARHIVLREVGGAGQQKLLAARVLVVGAGGLGAPALLYLAAAGVGHLGIVDDDVVALSNLQRQIIHTSRDVGRRKTLSARDAVAALNPDVRVSLHDCRLTSDNAAGLVMGYDLMLDGSDNFATRFALNDACLAARRPLVSAAVGPFDGQLGLYKGYEAGLPCYRCFVPDMPPGGDATCADEGILGALTGVMGALAALEAIKEIVGFGETLAGRLLLYDALATR
ncbi:MAG: molybdopterin-synthase adenylyltransferase MoeB, partial [Alphaproteobacteria bacterium]